jgi:hypothetical protein
MKKFKYVPAADFTEPIHPASKEVPEWFKKIPAFSNGNPSIEGLEKHGLTIKQCMPFLDSLTAGYMLVTWQDMQVKQVNGKPIVTWLVSPDPLMHRNPHEGLPIPAGHDATQFAWYVPIHYKTPKGYSILITHPLNRVDLPFLTASAIIDSDEGMFGGQLSFYMRESFEGIIPKGTPIAQVLPFKKENWEMEEDKSLIETAKKLRFLSGSVLKGWYKNSVWNRVTYK